MTSLTLATKLLMPATVKEPFFYRNITNLVVIGGDGSLTGANCFRNEWPGELAYISAEGYYYDLFGTVILICVSYENNK